MKLIIDCNVLISAGIKDGLYRVLLRETLQKGKIYLSREVILEYLLVSRRDKFKAHQSYLEKFIELLALAAYIVEPTSSPFDLPDSSDKKYLDLAESVRADFLITGNLGDFPEKKYGRTEVLSPRSFIDMFSKELCYMKN